MNAKLLVVGALAAGMTLFAWESVSNGALPWHMATMKTFSDSTAAVRAVRAHAPENGLYFDPRGILSVVSLTPDMADKSALMGPMMAKQVVLDVVVAFLFLIAMSKLPRLTTLQYGMTFAVATLGFSLSTFISNWNWWGFPAAWTAVQVVDRTIGFALMGLVLGSLLNRWSPKSNTDEWGGVKAHGGPRAALDASAPARRG